MLNRAGAPYVFAEYRVKALSEAAQLIILAVEGGTVNKKVSTCVGWTCRVPSQDRVDVQLALGDKEVAASVGLGFGLQYLLNALPNVIVAGIPTVERAVINKKEDDTT